MIGYALHLTLRNMHNRAIHSALTALVVGLAVALSVTITVLADGVQQGITQASEGFGVLVIGPKGSAQQLVLNTIFLQDVPVGLIDSSVYEPFQKANDRLKIVPLVMGDNIGGAPIIGTDQNFFLLRRRAGDLPLFGLVGGRLFTRNFEAVLGAEAASQLRIKIGDTFHSAHGVGKGLASDVHEQITYTVVGVLSRSFSPYDRAVFTTTGSIWATHEQEAFAPRFVAPQATKNADEASSDGLAAVKGKVTAAFVLPFGIPLSDIYRISQQINNSATAQAVFPGAQLGSLFDLLGQGQAVLNAVSWLTLVMAGLTILLSLYTTTLARQQAIAVMRSLGAGRSVVFLITLLEAMLLAFGGVVVGVVLGHIAATVIGQTISVRSALPIQPRIVWTQELPLLLIPLLVGAVSGILPAVMAYRINVVENLFSN